MWKTTTYMMLIFFPLFIVLIYKAFQDLLSDKTGYSVLVKNVEVPLPSFTICPFTYKSKSPDQAFRALNYGNGTDLPIKVAVYVGKKLKT